ncbi:hypothetical protein VTK73DRAFT_3449 [Phialemonium thermophilum]|uniref:Uncharacterized protein n=1 Tax=Phialemonium thermophilum TaxID=223376 RepID=A0ABR3WYV5_9PEZI
MEWPTRPSSFESVEDCQSSSCCSIGYPEEPRFERWKPFFSGSGTRSVAAGDDTAERDTRTSRYRVAQEGYNQNPKRPHLSRGHGHGSAPSAIGSSRPPRINSLPVPQARVLPQLRYSLGALLGLTQLCGLITLKPRKIRDLMRCMRRPEVTIARRYLS